MRGISINTHCHINSITKRFGYLFELSASDQIWLEAWGPYTGSLHFFLFTDSGLLRVSLRFTDKSDCGELYSMIVLIFGFLHKIEIFPKKFFNFFFLILWLLWFFLTRTCLIIIIGEENKICNWRKNLALRHFWFFRGDSFKNEWPHTPFIESDSANQDQIAENQGTSAGSNSRCFPSPSSLVDFCFPLQQPRELLLEHQRFEDRKKTFVLSLAPTRHKCLIPKFSRLFWLFRTGTSSQKKTNKPEVNEVSANQTKKKGKRNIY